MRFSVLSVLASTLDSIVYNSVLPREQAWLTWGSCGGLLAIVLLMGFLLWRTHRALQEAVRRSHRAEQRFRSLIEQAPFAQERETTQAALGRHWKGGELTQMAIASDITDRRQAEAALRQAKAALELRVVERTAELVEVNARLQQEILANQLAGVVLQESEDRYRSMVSVLSEGITLQDRQGFVLTSNASAERILGLSIEQMNGQTALDPRWQTIHEDGSPFPRENYPANVTLQTGKPCHNVVMGVSKPDGQLTWISINTQPLFRLQELQPQEFRSQELQPQEPVPYAVVASFSDITARKQAEEQVHLFQTLAVTIGESPDFNSALAQVLRSVCKTTGWDYGEAWIPCSEGNVLECSPAHYINTDRDTQQLFQLNEFRALSAAFRFPSGVGISGRVWVSQRPEWQQDVSQDLEQLFPRRAIALQSGIKTGLGIPIVVEGQVLTVLVFFRFEAVDENKQLVESLLAIAAQLGSVLRRKQAEVALRESESRFRAFMSHNPAVAFMKDESGRSVYINQTFEQTFNVQDSEVQGRSDFDWLPEEVARQIQENDATVLATGQALELIETVPALDGSLHHWLTVKFPFQDTTGNRYIGGVAIDITERQQIEEALRQSEARNRAMLQALPDLLLRLKRDGTCLDCIIPQGSQPGSFLPVQEHLAEVLPPELLQCRLQDMEQAIRTGEVQVREQKFIKQDKLAHEEVRIVAINDNEVIVLVRDVNDRKQAEIALQQSEQKFKGAFETITVGMCLISFAGGFQEVNTALCQMLGYSESELLALRLEDIIAPDQESDLKLLERLFAAEISSYQVEKQFLRQDKHCFWGWFNVALMRNSQGEPLYFIAQIANVHDRKQTEVALKQSEIRYRAIVEDQTELISRSLADGTISFVNQAYALYFDKSPEELIGKPYQQFIPEEDLEKVMHLLNSMDVNNPVAQIENRVTVKGELRWTQWHNRMLFDEQGRFMEFQSVGRDITALKQTEETLFQEKELAQVTLQSIGDAVITTDANGKIQYLNPVAESLTGWSLSSARELPLAEVFRIVSETTREPVQNSVERALEENLIVGLASHTVLIAHNGQEIAIEHSAAPIHNREGQRIGAVIVFHDVTQTRTLTRHLSWQASHDALTELVNRREFERRVEQALKVAKLDHQTHTLCYLDLDRFKIVNDTCGHAAGDELLRQIAALFHSHIRKSDTLARIGGDEFGILLTQCPLPQAQSIANLLREKVQDFRFVWQQQQFTIGVSIGLAVIDYQSQDAASVLKASDAACYLAKNRGRNRVHVYEADDADLTRQQGEMQWVTRITQALEENHFRLYYQSIVPTDVAAPIGEHYEVLLRLQESETIIPPMAFIPAAERYNLMSQIDRWVIRTLFATQGPHYRKIWQRVQAQPEDSSKYLYAINLSGASINDDQFLDFLHEQVALHQIPPQLICFEITETVAIANLSKAAHLIGELRKLGFRLALDDFGAGMSSFAYLKHLRADYLKIDGGFIKQILHSPVDEVIVQAMRQISNVLGIQTIAEFVEDDAILQKVRDLGINHAQGYGIAVPRPLT